MSGDERQVRGVVVNAVMFRNSLKAIKDANLRERIQDAIKGMLFRDLDQLPAKLKFHQLKNREVPSATVPGKKVTVWSMHVTADDVYKASFTLEDNVMYMRLVDAHDQIDKRP